MATSSHYHTSTAMPHYLLHPDVFVCRAGSKTVLLDLRRGRYLGVSGKTDELLARVVSGWPCPGASAKGAGGEADTKALQALISRGLITADARAGKPATPVQHPPPARSIAERLVRSRPRFTSRQLLQLIGAAAGAAALLRFRPLIQVVSRVAWRRAKAGSEHHDAWHADVPRIEDLVNTFNELQPLLFSARDACLFHSLTLIEFLARYRLFPAWVFAVRADPFAAHCWVQYGDIVLNDTPEHAGLFQPIMVV